MGRDNSVGMATRYALDVLGNVPIPVALRLKARVCGRSHAGVAVSNPAGGMNVCVVCCK